MGRKKGRKQKETAIYSRPNALAPEDFALVEHAKDILKTIQKKYDLTKDQLADLLDAELHIPLSIFNKSLTTLHSLVKYLKENKQLSYAQIAPLINRDQRNVWRMYDDARKKQSSLLSSKSAHWIPLSVFSDTELSAQEALVAHLKDSVHLSYHEIAAMLGRDDRTIWTVYSRARKKHG